MDISTKDWREEVANYPKLLADFEIKPENIALIIVHMQYYVAYPDYGLGKILLEQNPQAADYFFSRLNMVIPNCSRILRFFRDSNLKVFHVLFGASLPDGSDMVPLRKMRDAEIERQTGIRSMFKKGAFEHQIVDELKPEPGELEINNTTRCSFTGTNLDHILRMVGIETVVVVGAVTNVCVETTARGASDRGYKPVIVDDATATFSQQMQDSTMISFGLFFGKVVSTVELLTALSENS